jgi:heme-degrading monooxygenase HmoA
VPPAARDEFLARARETHAFLHTLPGFVTSAIFQQSRGPGAFNFVTLVEWESAEAVEGAQKTVEAKYKSAGFNPQEVRARLGIEADVATYSAATSPLA